MCLNQILTEKLLYFLVVWHHIPYEVVLDSSGGLWWRVVMVVIAASDGGMWY